MKQGKIILSSLIILKYLTTNVFFFFTLCLVNKSMLGFSNVNTKDIMNSMQTCNSVTFYFMKNSFPDISMKCISPNMMSVDMESIHTKDESKRGSAFAFIFGVN